MINILAVNYFLSLLFQIQYRDLTRKYIDQNQRVSGAARNVVSHPGEKFSMLNTACWVFPLFSNFREELPTFGALLCSFYILICKKARTWIMDWTALALKSLRSPVCITFRSSPCRYTFHWLSFQRADLCHCSMPTPCLSVNQVYISEGILFMWRRTLMTEKTFSPQLVN